MWVNDYFCAFTGYGPRGRARPQLPLSSRATTATQPAAARVREAVARGEAVHVLIRNVKADGTPFENDLYVSPVRDAAQTDGAVPRYYIGVQNDSTARVCAERKARERTREIAETAENERERFGMDLHDGLGQELAGTRLLAHALADRLAAEGSPHAEAAARIADVLGDALESARDMARGLNPVDASAHGLGDALRDLARFAGESTPGTAVTALVEPVTFADRRQARHLYRIAQEALANALHHARASEILVALHRSPREVRLDVADDGVGVPDAVLADERAGAEPARRSMGLYGMRHRAALIGATLSVSRCDSGGTVVRCVLPLSEAEAPGQRDRTGERE